MASNAGIAISPAINFDSWIEVYNPSDQAINLGGMYLSDEENNLTKWQMPSDMGKVPANGFKVIWLGSGDSNKLQAPFKLDCDGGTIYLSDTNGSLIVSQTYPTALSRTAWARKTDGGDEWGWTSTPTPEATNATATFANQRLSAPKVSVGSKLFTSSLTINVDIPEGARLAYTTDGCLPANLAPWAQWVKNGDCEDDDTSCLVIKNGDKGKNENRITDGIGVNDSRGVTVHSIKNAKNDNTTQFFVYTPDHTWKTGEKYRFSMKVRADKAAKIKAFAQKKPGEDIITGGNWWGGGDPVNMLKNDGTYDVTTEWTTISYEGVLTAEQAGEQRNGGWGGWGGWGGGGNETVTYSLQTIAFNLNINKSDENNFYFDEISWESENPTKESKDGKFTITETTNFTFRLFQDGYLPSVPVTRSYIKTSNKYTLPIISIVGDQKFFTDPKIGFDCDGDGTNGKTGNGQGSPRNYNCDWDRPANFSFLSPEGEMLFNQDVNISASGGYTRSQTYRSFKLKSNKIFDGQNRLDYLFFPQKPYNRNKVLLIRNGGNDMYEHNARFMDPALETIIQRSGIDLDVQSYVPVIEYVNGKLRGVLNMREPNNDKFAYANFGYDDEELDALENEEVKNGSDEVMKRIYELGKKINEEGAYEELMTLLDIDEYTNYMAVTFFLYNDDWPDNNVKCYRSQNDGRYRFVSFDLDYAFKRCWKNESNDNPFTNFYRFKDENGPHHNNAPKVANKEFVNLFLNLLKHDGYRKKFIDTFCLMGGSVFEPTRAGKIVDELYNNVKAMCQLMKQQGINDGHDPDRAVSTIKNNLKGRSKKMTDYMKKFSQMKLSNITQQTVQLSTDTEGASLFVNGLEVPYADFDGHLFAPVTLEAKAPAGYKFTGWKNGDDIVSTTAEMELPDDATVSLVACFEALSDDQLMAQGITPVRINEVSAANSIYANEYWKRNDWVELYNTTNSDIDVAGMYLSDNANKPKKYQIAADGASTIIPAHGYLIVWCDKLDPTSQLHATFKLAAEGGDVLLTAEDESWCDHFVYNEHKGDETVGRYPDGAAEVFVMNVPTIAKSNVMSSYMTAVEQPIITGIRDLMADTADELSVRYLQGNLALRSTSSEHLQVRIANLAGQTVITLQAQLNGGYTEVNVDQLPSGVYVAIITDQQGHKATCKFIKR